MIFIPIISLSINESLKKFISKLLSKNQYDNKSKLIRDALLRLMSTMDTTTIDLDSEIIEVSKRIVGNMIIVIPNDFNVQKKINKIESVFHKQIVSKNQHFHQNGLTIFLVYEGYLEDFHKLVVEINSIKEIKNFRYLIVN